MATRIPGSNQECTDIRDFGSADQRQIDGTNSEELLEP